MKRKIVHIDEKLCNGCGQCVPNCVEQALQIVNGKAKIVKDIYCDGLGACLGYCPMGAITIIEREAEAFDHEKVHKHITNQKNVSDSDKNLLEVQWPVKLDLVSPKAQFFENSEILFVADCVPVVLEDFHRLTFGKKVIIGCPKFNDAMAYATKLAEILKLNNIVSISVMHMEVPCCVGLKWVVTKALDICGKSVLVKVFEVKIGGQCVEFK
ncbi:MAG: 4Fe-4S ferredoxin [Candidatus Bathyarchaeota archaeon]|nr:4Fe-4S ferredoxin [Candidatus Termiticorpusculum sp.]